MDATMYVDQDGTKVVEHAVTTGKQLREDLAAAIAAHAQFICVDVTECGVTHTSDYMREGNTYTRTLDRIDANGFTLSDGHERASEIR